MRVLLIAPNSDDRKRLVLLLESGGFAVDGNDDKTEAIQMIAKQEYDVCLLSFESSKKNIDWALVEELRQSQEAMRILTLLGEDFSGNPIEAFHRGADDFLICPYQTDELVERLRVLCRRKYDIAKPVIEVDDLIVDCTNRTASRLGQEIDLTPREFALLEYLALRKGQVVSREDIWNHVYDTYDQVTSSNVVDVYIGYLRKKIEKPELPRIIHTRRGHGYVLGIIEDRIG